MPVSGGSALLSWQHCSSPLILSMKKLVSGIWLALLPLVAVAQKKVAATNWQQTTNYSIDVALNDQQHVLTGQEELTYVNHSPSALPYIWFHLWPNAYRDNNTAFARQQLRNGSRKF